MKQMSARSSALDSYAQRKVPGFPFEVQQEGSASSVIAVPLDIKFELQHIKVSIKRIALPPNDRMEPTCQTVTFLACASKAPVWHAAHARRWADIVNRPRVGAPGWGQRRGRRMVMQWRSYVRFRKA